MKRKNQAAAPQPLATSTAERIGAIVEAAERAAVAVIDDAEKQAQRHLEEAQAEADRIVSERLAALTRLTESLAAQAEAAKGESEKLVAKLEEAKRRLAAGDDFEEVASEPDELDEPARASHLSAVAPVEEAEEEGAGQGTPAGARLLATQMAVSGSSREEIEERLRGGFDLEDTGPILDAILGPED
jgi:cell division septum initiation protein DivIVA